MSPFAAFYAVLVFMAESATIAEPRFIIVGAPDPFTALYAVLILRSKTATVAKTRVIMRSSCPLITFDAILPFTSETATIA